MGGNLDTAEMQLRVGTRVPTHRLDASEDKSSHTRHIVSVLGSAAATLAIAYGVGAFYFSTHFVPRTTVNGVDASGLSTRELASVLDDAAATYANHVTGDGFDLTINASDVGLMVNGASLAAEALGKTNPFAWPISLLNGSELSVDMGVSLDEDLLSYVVADAVYAYNETAEQPKDATATFDQDQSAYVLAPSELGTALDSEAVRRAVGKNLIVMRPATTLGEDQLLRAPIQDDNAALLAAIDEANEVCSMTIPLTLDGKTLLSVTPDIIASWVSVQNTEDGPEVVVDQQAIYQWSYDNLNSVVNGENETRGWEVSSWDFAYAMAPKLESADSSALEVPTITTFTRPAESEGHESRGRHIDVNISTQFARLYDSDGKTVLWRSPFVSGNLSLGHGTPLGTFTINALERNVTLTGLNDGVEVKEGEEPKPEDYYTSEVAYWMPFLGSEYGLHDANWRWDEEFGGDTYLWNGSHGCINLPVDAAGQLFDLLHVGDEVYIHE